MHVGAVAILDRELNESTVMAGVERALTQAPELRQRLWEPGPLRGGPVWIDDGDFSPRRHVRHQALPPGSDEAALLECTARLLEPLLDRNHPMWQLWLVTGLLAGRSALVLKIHHAVADGLATLALVSSLLVPEATGRPAPPGWRPSPRPGTGDLLRDAWRRRLLAAGRALGHPLKTLRRVGWVVGDLGQIARGPRAARISINRPVRAGRTYRRQVFDLDELKTVVHRYGGRINDLVLLLAGAGMRELLKHRRELAVDTILQASVAVGQRGGGDPRGLGNAAGIVRVGLPVGEQDPVKSLHRLVADTAQAKRMQHPDEGTAFIAWLGLLGLARLFIRNQRLVNIHTSNVPGPTSPLQAFGATVVDAFPLTVLAGNTPVSFVAFSYAGRLSLVTLVDPSSVPEIDVIQRGITATWELLRPATPGPTGPRNVYRPALVGAAGGSDAEPGRRD
jgi:WS/DGAT/MGAT family acyltransferase